jgi:hypothetical protein
MECMDGVNGKSGGRGFFINGNKLIGGRHRNLISWATLGAIRFISGGWVWERKLTRHGHWVKYFEKRVNVYFLNSNEKYFRMWKKNLNVLVGFIK